MHYYKFYSLHTSLVSKEKRIILFAGKGACGKSTLAALLSLHGFKFLCDDMVFIRAIKTQFRIIPFMRKVAVKNFSRKKAIIKRIPSPKGLSGYTLAKNIIVIFPRYTNKRQGPSIRAISRKDGVSRLIKDNIVIENGQPHSKLSQIKNLDFLCTFGRKTKFYQLGYNDENLRSVPEAVKKILSQ